jgi:hypothetical protein
MALTGKTIGQLNHLTSSLTGNEAFPIQYSGSTYHISQSQIVANLATTGSNTFTGPQLISGSYGYVLLNENNQSPDYAMQSIHAINDSPWLARFYNDSYDTEAAVMSYFGWSDGRFVFHNESAQSIGIHVHGYLPTNGLLVYENKVSFVNNIDVTGSITSGNDLLVNGITVGRGPGINTENVALGYNVLSNNNGGAQNVGIGDYTLELSIGGEYNTAVGYNTLPLSINNLGNTAVGYYALSDLSSNNENNYNTTLGYNSGQSLQLGKWNVFLGSETNYIVTGSYNTIIGSQITALPSTLNNNIVLADGQGNIKYRWDGAQNTISGDLVATQNLYVQGTASINNIQYISQSSLNIGTNLITVNTATPTTRFGGLAVYDSGSTGTGRTGSMLWDSQNDTWIYSNPSGSSYDGAMVLMGPRNSSGLGNEVGITQYYAAIGDGSHHMTSSQIYNSGSLIRLGTNTQITGSLNVSGSITVSGSVVNNLTASFAQTASYIVTAQTASYYGGSVTSASYASSSTSASFAQTASYIVTAQTASYVNSLNQAIQITGILSGSQPTNNPSSSLLLISGSIRPTGSLSGSSAILINTVMSASANNQTLIGVNITPVFNNGAFTGVSNVGLKVLGNTQITGSLNITGSVTASSALISGPLTITGSNTVLFTSNIDTLTLTGSLLLSTGSMFGLPTTSSTTPVTGSMFWSGSLLFVWNGSRYMSASFA